MRWLLLAGCVVLLMQGITCPPVQPDVKPVEGDSPDDDDDIDGDPGFGLEYDRYLKEIVMALEEDEAFRKKLEETNMTDIKSGKIAMHLDLVSHQIRERLDEIKRQEMNRLRELAREKMKQMKGMEVLGSIAVYGGIQQMDEGYLHHVDIKNPHSFESKDLEKLIKKATNDLDEIDRKRKKEFKTYEMEKEHLRREELKNLDEEHRKAKEEEYEQMKKRHEDHPKVHHPGSKAQLEGVWEESDGMDAADFDPKTFFKMHDMNGDNFLDQDEVEALFQKELDQVYDPNVPEDDMRERYEDMARMREHVFGELDKDSDRLISIDEFMNYTKTSDFEKDEGWKTVDEEQNFTDEEYERYEKMLMEHEAKMRAQGLDPNMAQPGVVPLGQDPNVQHMQIPEGQGQGMHHGQGMPPQGMHHDQQQFQQQQFQHHGQQQQFQQHEQQQQMRQMGQMPAHAPMGQGQMHHGGQMPEGQGQMHHPGHENMHMQGGPPAMPPDQMPQGQMPPGHMPQGQRNIPRPPPDNVNIGQGDNVVAADNVVNQGGIVSEGEGQPQGQGQEINKQESQGQQSQNEAPAFDPKVPDVNDQPDQGEGQDQVEIQGQGQNQGSNNEKLIENETLDGPSPQGVNPPDQEGMPPLQGQVPHQQNAQPGHGQPVQGQDSLKFQGQGHHEQQKPPQQPLV